MKNSITALFIILTIALTPFIGFWIVALVGAGLLLLPISALVATLFPAAWRQLETSLLAKTQLLRTA